MTAIAWKEVNMKKYIILVICFMGLTCTKGFCSEKHTLVLMETSVGNIKIDLNYEKAPITVKNFLGYVDSGFFNNTVFHRVIPGFMIQGGGFNENMQKKATESPIKNEAGNGLKNDVGTIAMARTNVVDSATAQFFINVTDNHSLNHNANGFGYAVFGKVTEGMDVVRKIENTPTTTKGHHRNVPVKSVIIKSVKKIK